MHEGFYFEYKKTDKKISLAVILLNNDPLSEGGTQWIVIYIIA